MPWYGELRPNPQGIWTIRNGECAIGVVLLAKHDDKIALVRKAPVEGYEFSGMYALPGGLIRQQENSTFLASLTRSMMHRAAQECGLAQESLTELRLENFGNPPVTEYTIKGIKK